ncbi:hypothetical protein, partial [Streptomyces sp. HG99]
MDAVWLILGIVLVAGVALGTRRCWRLYRYPGSREDAFGPAHEAERQELDQHRDAVRSLRSTARQELRAARDRVAEVDQAYARQIRELEQAWQQEHEDVGRGEHGGSLGAVSLYKHVLVFKERDMPLKDLSSVEMKRDESHYYLYLIWPKGYKDYESFAFAEYTEQQVLDLEAAITNAVISEKETCADRAASIRTIEAKLAAARADTGPRQAARQH